MHIAKEVGKKYNLKENAYIPEFKKNDEDAFRL